MKLLATLSFALLLTTALGVHAKTIYQCTDHAGKTILSDGGGCRETHNKVPPKASQTGKPISASSGVKPAGSAPVTVSECNKTGCWSDHIRYTKVDKDNYVSSTGKSCKRAGNTMYCN